MRLRAEVTTEPFRGEGALPAHVSAAADALRAAGLNPDLGPLGTTVEGAGDGLLQAVHDAAGAAFAAGATRISLQIERTDA
ncbi:thiamine-binding protein [Flexivirga sp.]|uniref:thiamine-binding protein n=1 Tax=Flexivirga sp. TaxID=1962927 RepID=UPI003F80D184